MTADPVRDQVLAAANDAHRIAMLSSEASDNKPVKMTNDTIDILVTAWIGAPMVHVQDENGNELMGWPEGPWKTCMHLNGGPRPTMALFWYPWLMLCGECAAIRMHHVMTNHNTECELCHEVSDEFHEVMVQIGYTLLCGNLCPTCYESARP